LGPFIPTVGKSAFLAVIRCILFLTDSYPTKSCAYSPLI
jgi:hypothetical protein